MQTHVDNKVLDTVITAIIKKCDKMEKRLDKTERELERIRMWAKVPPSDGYGGPY